MGMGLPYRFRIPITLYRLSFIYFAIELWTIAGIEIPAQLAQSKPYVLLF